VQGLKDRHQLRGFDKEPTPGLDDTVVGDICDADLVRDAAADMEGIVHLVNVPGGSWENAQQSMLGTYNALEAAVHHGAKRFVYASRAGVLPRSVYPRTIQRTADMPTRPDSYYSVTKVFAENLGFMYTERHDLEFVAVRIGNYKLARDLPEDPHHLSHGDCVRVFEQGLIHPGVKFEIVFGVSDSDWPLYDLDHGRRVIGYDPQDRSHVPEDERQ
jgi:uronate dehydrogenase